MPSSAGARRAQHDHVDEQQREQRRRSRDRSTPRLAQPDRPRPPTTAAGCSGGWAGAGCRSRGRRAQARAIQSPSASCGANTWIRPIALLAMPATTRPMQKARKADDAEPGPGDAGADRPAPARRRAACRPTRARATTARRRRPTAPSAARTRIAIAASRASDAARARPGVLRQPGAQHHQEAAPADEGRRLVEEGRRRRDVEGDQRRHGDGEAGQEPAAARGPDGGGGAVPAEHASEEAVERKVAEHVTGLVEYGDPGLARHDRQEAGRRLVDLHLGQTAARVVRLRG